ncbi:phosphate signaling complex protein PhoU [Luteococcus japonicus]|uniref:Phosphate-specific transport system accessory protein PhoU n=1 Tax=Luteococcus japonicus LSP_Lj1 TaxID=1255658 RepID=A0A1R4I748_9ACTN|nr:phosphate signaling complex protein PhoU [Luteococcus japonicus]SJN15701.1 Phosphate transport system regulatory protein PhoU [Luteococcus japonicus LSP_Lj1]
MRETYHEELNDVVNQLVSMSSNVRTQVHDATRALLEADLRIAERVIADDARLDAMHEQIEKQCFQLLARQAPVAGELRTIVAALRMVFELARMGDLAAHIAKIARLRYPEHAVPAPLEANFTRMAQLADAMIAAAGRTLDDRDVEEASKLAENDEEMDELRAEQFKVLLADDWEHGVEMAVDAALLGRYYERIADHAVAMGRRIIYVITGEAPDGENWPNA